MCYVGRELGWARKGKGGEDGADPGQLGWVSFRHHTARPTLAVQDGPGGATYLCDAPVGGDPHAHIHNALFNMVVTEDGRIGSLDTQRLQKRVLEFGSIAQASWQTSSGALAPGCATTRRRRRSCWTRSRDLPTMPSAFANDAFSKSSKQVLRDAKAFATSQGLDWNVIPAERKFEILRGAAMAERLDKHAGKSDRALAGEFGLSLFNLHILARRAAGQRQLMGMQKGAGG